MTNSPVHVLCLYRIKPGQEPAFLELLRRHWPALRRSGLATDEPAQVERARDRKGGTVLVERFAWRSPESSALAHQSPDVMAVWEPMGALCDGMEFLHVEPVKIDFVG